MKLALLIVAFALPLAAQTPKPPAAPTIPDAVVSRFWKAQSQVQQAESALQNARAQMQAVVTQMGDACGKDFQAQMSPQGDPACVAKPAEPKEKK